MKRRVPRKPTQPSQAQRIQQQRMAAYQRQMRDLTEPAKRYTAEGLAMIIFFGTVVMMALMGLPLLYSVGGPVFATPFIYAALKGLDPEGMVKQMTQPPGDERLTQRWR